MSARKMPMVVTDDDPRYSFFCGIRAKHGVLIFSILRLLDLFRLIPGLLPPAIPYMWFYFVIWCLMLVLMLGILLDNYCMTKAWLVYAPLFYICIINLYVRIIAERFSAFYHIQESEYSHSIVRILMEMIIGLIIMVLVIIWEYKAGWLQYTFLRDSKTALVMREVLADNGAIDTYEQQIDKAAPSNPVEDHCSQAFRV